MQKETFEERLVRLEKQVNRLVQEYYLVHQKLKASISENERLTRILGEKEEEIKNFQNQHKISKIVSSITDETHEQTELKLKINEFIREIDKCIAHLSE